MKELLSALLEGDLTVAQPILDEISKLQDSRLCRFRRRLGKLLWALETYGETGGSWNTFVDFCDWIKTEFWDFLSDRPLGLKLTRAQAVLASIKGGNRRSKKP